MPPLITHLATKASDGAGIGTKRIHESLLTSGVRSRLLVRDPGNTGPETRVLGQPPHAWTERLARRLPFAASARSKREHALNALLARPGPAPELFSLPYARTHPEDAEWTREARIVHLHWVAGFIDYEGFFPRMRSPLVWTLHDQQPYLGGFHYALDRDTHPDFGVLEMECLALKRAALDCLKNPLLVIGNSEWNTTAARTSGFFPKHTRFETVYYPLNFQDYTSRDKAAAKVALGVDPRACVVGFACTGLDNTRKGLADLLSALRIIEAIPGHLPVTLLSFGRAPSETLRATLKSRWQHLGFLDADTVKCSAYSAMDCFVIPSHAEAFGQTAIEALASGTCVLGADVGGIPETMPSATRAHALFRPGDTADLAARLQTLLASPALRAELAAQGLDHVRKQHDSAAVAGKLTGLYSELTART
jgi:glycosyltransferase involved in cell wall biosynthesis